MALNCDATQNNDNKVVQTKKDDPNEDLILSFKPRYINYKYAKYVSITSFLFRITILSDLT